MTQETWFGWLYRFAALFLIVWTAAFVAFRDTIFLASMAMFAPMVVILRGRMIEERAWSMAGPLDIERGALSVRRRADTIRISGLAVILFGVGIAFNEFTEGRTPGGERFLVHALLAWSFSLLCVGGGAVLLRRGSGEDACILDADADGLRIGDNSSYLLEWNNLKDAKIVYGRSPYLAFHLHDSADALAAISAPMRANVRMGQPFGFPTYSLPVAGLDAAPERIVEAVVRLKARYDDPRVP